MLGTDNKYHLEVKHSHTGKKSYIPVKPVYVDKYIMAHPDLESIDWYYFNPKKITVSSLSIGAYLFRFSNNTKNKKVMLSVFKRLKPFFKQVAEVEKYHIADTATSDNPQYQADWQRMSDMAKDMLEVACADTINWRNIRELDLTILDETLPKEKRLF